MRKGEESEKYEWIWRTVQKAPPPGKVFRLDRKEIL